MPTAVEYATAHPWHAQDGCATGSPRLNLWEAQNGVGSGPPVHTTVLPQPTQPGTNAGDWLLAGAFLAPLLLVAVVVAVRRRVVRHPARAKAPVLP